MNHSKRSRGRTSKEEERSGEQEGTLDGMYLAEEGMRAAAAAQKEALDSSGLFPAPTRPLPLPPPLPLPLPWPEGSLLPLLTGGAGVAGGAGALSLLAWACE